MSDIDTAEFLNRFTVLGALFGIFVAISLAVNFVIIRKDNTLPFELALGLVWR